MVKRNHSHYQRKNKQWGITGKIELNQDKPTAEQTSNTAEIRLALVDMA